MGDVIDFPGEDQPVDALSNNNRFVTGVVESYLNLGLDVSYCAMLGRYLTDLEVTVSRHVEESTSVLERDKHGEWVRKLRIPLSKVGTYENALSFVLDDFGIESTQHVLSVTSAISDKKSTKHTETVYGNASLDELAVNWLFFESTADVLSEVYLMQRRFDRYIPDFGNLADDTFANISSQFFEDYADGEDIGARAMAVGLDYRNYRSGVALLQMRDELVRRRVVDTVTDANCITGRLSRKYPSTFFRRSPSVSAKINPLSYQEIVQRNLALAPLKGTKDFYSGYTCN